MILTNRFVAYCLSSISRSDCSVCWYSFLFEVNHSVYNGRKWSLEKLSLNQQQNYLSIRGRILILLTDSYAFFHDILDSVKLPNKLLRLRVFNNAPMWLFLNPDKIFSAINVRQRWNLPINWKKSLSEKVPSDLSSFSFSEVLITD